MPPGGWKKSSCPWSTYENPCGHEPFARLGHGFGRRRLGNGYIVFTHDLDFGILLALTHVEGPSVVQVRAQDVLPEVLGDRLVAVLQEWEARLETGALLTVDEGKSRIRILPFE